MSRTRPRPLTIVGASSRPNSSDHHSLTPRTPHSRSRRAEEGYTDIELEEINQADNDYRSYDQQQAEPLLASSAGDTIGYRSQGDEYDGNGSKVFGIRGLSMATVLSRIPLAAGSLVAGILLILILVSVKRPDVLDRYIGATVPGAESSSASATPKEDLGAASPSPKPAHLDPHIISYENYTKFPLLSTEYLAECHKLNKGFMSHGSYWQLHSMGMLDVLHHDDNRDYTLPEGGRTSVCKSTITYMLDGHVGLLADLALMAQAAALAREVCGNSIYHPFLSKCKDIMEISYVPQTDIAG